MAARIEPHVSVIYELVDIDRLRIAAAAAAPLRLRIAGAGRWEGEASGIYLEVLDPQQDLARFRKAVHGEDLAGYHPHVTLLHKDSITRTGQSDEAWNALHDVVVDTDFVVSELIVHELTAEVWREVARVRLG